MKLHAYFLILFLGSFHFQNFYAQPGPGIYPEVKQVTVFRSGCQVVREATVPLKPGVQELVFSGFGSGYDQNSIQIKPPASVRILSTSFESNFLNPLEKSADYKALLAEQKAMDLKIAQENIQRENISSEIDLLLANKVVGGTESGLNPEALIRTAEIYRTRLPELRNKLLQSQLSLQSLKEQKTKIDQQLAEMQSRHPQQENLEVRVLVESTSASLTQVFGLSYFHPAAGWTTAYDLRVKTLSAPMELLNRALIWQTTGEDWKNIALKVSTGSPRRQMTPSELNTLKIDFQHEVMLLGARKNYDITQMRAANVRSEAPLDEVVVVGPEVTVRENLTFLEYQLPGLSNLASSGKPGAFELETNTIPAEYKYYVVPKLDQYAFLQAYISNWEDYNLAQGEISIYFEGTFVGKHYFDPHQVKDTLAISLGPDIAVQVKRERIKEKSKTSTLFGKQVKDVAFQIKVRNSKPNTIDITIVDQVPVSIQSSIEVEVEQISGADLDKETGKLTWSEKIAPGKTVTKDLIYKVKYPKGRRILPIE